MTTDMRPALAAVAGLLLTAGCADNAAAPREPASVVKGLTPVGSPLPAGEAGRRWSQAVSADGRVYAVSETEKGAGKVVAVDPATGRKIWETGGFREFHDYGGPIALPGAMIVNEAGTLHFLDPATGKRRWKLKWTNDDAYVASRDTLVRSAGRTEAFDLASGKRLWTAPAAERSVAAGSEPGWTEAQQYFGPRISLGDRLVQVTAGGDVVMRDLRSGRAATTLRAGLPGADQAVADGGTLYTGFQGNDGEPYRIRATDLTGGETRVLYQRPIELRSGAFRPCGPDRLCLGTFDDLTSKTGVVAIDTRSGATLWHVSMLTQINGDFWVRGGRMLYGDQVTTAVHDADGALVISGPGAGQWLDDENLLWSRDRMLSAVSVVDGSRTDLGSFGFGNCAVEPAFMACPDESVLRVWRFAR